MHVAAAQVVYRPSGQVASRLGMSGRCLSMLTGSLFVRVDDKRIDVGLCVKHVQHGLCVPDYVRPQPEGTGWLYSPALQQALEAYKVSTAASHSRSVWISCRDCRSLSVVLLMPASATLPNASASQVLHCKGCRSGCMHACTTISVPGWRS